MKTVFLTGASGSLGKMLSVKLKERGYNVFESDMIVDGFDLSEEHDVHLLSKRFQEKMGVTYPDFTIHCAATIFGVAGFNENDYTILANDIKATINVLDYFPAMEKFVYLSSSMVYERSGYGPGYGVKEEVVLQTKAPLTGYGLSKYVGETLVKFHGNNYTIWRPFNIITPYEEAQEELGYSHVFADYFNNILIKKLTELPIIGDGRQVRAFTWIGDVVDCIVDNLENPNSDKQEFNIGNNEPITMRNLADKIFQEGVKRGILKKGNLTFKTVKNFDRDVLYRAPHIEKARERLGFTPTVNTQRAIELCMDEWEKKL